MSADASIYDLQNVECQSLIPSCKISSRPPRFTKRTVMNLSDVLNRRLCLQQPMPACGLTHGCVTMLSDSQGCEPGFSTSFSFYSCVTMRESLLAQTLNNFLMFLPINSLSHNGWESNIHSACNCACF